MRSDSPARGRADEVVSVWQARLERQYLGITGVVFARPLQQAL
jgi:hypothetical protein